MFRVRIFTVDHYMSPPIPDLDVTYSDFRKSSIKQVPVIRIFGTTPKGDKTCVHVHGVFPYICVPYDGSEPHTKLSYQLAASLDKAINIASGYSTSNTQHVYKVVLVSGIPFYGYHNKRHQFLKIYFYKPSVIKQAVNLLQNGAILNKVFQPHEAHIPFILQFFIDFNLYGMSFIDFQCVKFRRTNFPDLLSEIPSEHILPDTIPAVSLSQLEVDASACHISNRPSSQGDGQICNPGISAIWEDENRRRALQDGTPNDFPPLHSQRPPQKPTASELFYLDRIQHVLDNPSQPSDDSSLSGEPVPLSNKSYAMEAPPNTSALDASFVSMHVTEAHPDARVSSNDILEDTIVDEDLVLMNTSMSISQRLSQTLDKSLALDYEDLELLDALETLADTRAAAVDEDSVLGSQTSKSKCAHTSIDNGEEINSDEDEQWMDKTLVAEEDEALKLFDLTMPDFDETAILNKHAQDECHPGPSKVSQDHLLIPQIDGASDISLEPKKPRRKLQIPQVDGLNDIPSKPLRKSLGMRGGMSRQIVDPPKDNADDFRYIPGTRELIFKTNRKVALPTLSASSSKAPVVPIQEGKSNFLPPSSENSVESSRLLPCEKTSSEPHLDAQEVLINTDLSKMNCPSNCEVLIPEVQAETHAADSLICSTQSTIENTIQETEPVIYLLPSSKKDVKPSSVQAVQNTCNELVLPYFPVDMPLQDKEVVRNLQPAVACCNSVGCSEDCEEHFECTDVFIDLLSNKKAEPVLRGDPSLYPEAPPEKEELLSELITSSVCKNDGVLECYENEYNNKKSVNTEESHSVRRSNRLASRDHAPQQQNIVETAAPEHWSPFPLTASEDELLEDPAANLSPCSCDEISVSGIPGFTTNMFNDIRETLVDWGSSNNDASCSDSEMSRLRGALESGQMEEILQSGSNVLVTESSTSRRDELMLFLESQKTKSECLGTCSKAKRKNDNAIKFVDPVTDELLHRGVKAVAGPPKGKNMTLAKLYCSTPMPEKTKEPGVAGHENLKERKRALRQERRLKLSVSAQKRKKSQSAYQMPSVTPCSVVLEALTKKNIYYVCRQSQVKLMDKSALGIKSRSKSQSTLPKEVPAGSQPSETSGRSCSNVSDKILLRSRKPDTSVLKITKSFILSSGRSLRSKVKSSCLSTLTSADVSDNCSNSNLIPQCSSEIEVKDESNSEDETSVLPLALRLGACSTDTSPSKSVKKQRGRKRKCPSDLSTLKKDNSEEQINFNSVLESQPVSSEPSSAHFEALPKPSNAALQTKSEDLARNMSACLEKILISNGAAHFSELKVNNNVQENSSKVSHQQTLNNYSCSVLEPGLKVEVDCGDTQKKLHEESIPLMKCTSTVDEPTFSINGVTNETQDEFQKEFTASFGSTPTSVKIVCNDSVKFDPQTHESKCSDPTLESDFLADVHLSGKEKKRTKNKHKKREAAHRLQLNVKSEELGSSCASSVQCDKVSPSSSIAKKAEIMLKEVCVEKSNSLPEEISMSSNEANKHMLKKASSTTPCNFDTEQVNSSLPKRQVSVLSEEKRTKITHQSSNERKKTSVQEDDLEKKNVESSNSEVHMGSSNLRKEKISASSSHQRNIQPQPPEHSMVKGESRHQVKENLPKPSSNSKLPCKTRKRSSSIPNSNEMRRSCKDSLASSQQGILPEKIHNGTSVASKKHAFKEHSTLKSSSSLKNALSCSGSGCDPNSKSSASFPKGISIPDLIPEIKPAPCFKTYKIPKKSEQELNEINESIASISLDASNICLHLSGDIDDASLSKPAGKGTLQVGANVPNHQNSLQAELVDKTHTNILCVDGASNESSSDSCASQGEIPASQQLLKRRTDETMNHSSSKVTKVDETGMHKKILPEAAESTNLPKSVAHWFAKPYGPWCLWSPDSSPKQRNHTHLFSPPQPVSPGKYPDLSFSGYAAVSHGCMDEREESVLATDNSASKCDVDALLSTQSLETKLSCSSLGSCNSKLNAEMYESAGVVDESSGKTSHSILDMFSEASFNSYEDSSSDEENQCVNNLTSICLNPSPSSSLSSPNVEKISPGSRWEDNCSMPPKASDSTTTSEENQILFPSNTSTNESSLGGFKLSDKSFDIPCGQNTIMKTSRGRSSREAFSPTLKTLQKPPSRKEVVDTLSYFNLPEVVNQEPFFSNYFDVKGKIDVGGNVLDLTSRSGFHLEEFRSGIPGLRGLSLQQKHLFGRLWGLSQIRGDFNQLVSCHLNERKTVISPVKRPPSVRDVALWAKAKSIALKERNLKEEKEEMPQCGESSAVQDSVSHAMISLSFHSFPTMQSETDGIIQASTPDGRVKSYVKAKVPSPLLTPILQAKSQMAVRMTVADSKKFSKSLHFQSPLPSVPERDEDDIGVKVLEGDAMRGVSSVEKSNEEHEDSSLKQLLANTQFCKEAASPLFRHDLEASACQIKGINSSPGFKMVFENLQTVKTVKDHQYVTLLSIEVHVCTCGNLNPDPERDQIRAVFYSVWNDVPENHRVPSGINGIIAVNCDSSTPLLNRCGINSDIEYTSDEKSLLAAVLCLVHKWDPDILAGFETEMLSWGYMLQRASVLGLNLAQDLSRIPNLKERKQVEEFEDNNGMSGLKITGRIVLDVWRLFRSEVALQSYTFENLMYHVLHQRVCRHSFEDLSRWWENPSHLHRWITVKYYQQRVCGVVRLLDQLDIIGRTSELARLFGIQFFEVLSRGSQFRVESMMLRLAKPLNYIPVSPSVQQRAHMRAPECLPLIMEPESRFYADPMIVLDFQSLYPSMIIAYNYCFSTCLGRVEHLGKSAHFEFGCSELRVKNSCLQQLKDHISVSPSGVAFVTKAVRHGVLPRMLEEILEARLAVKQSMKNHKSDHTLQRVLHARQLGLKLIANVTYGYTSANFSGRMPCIEVGDSVVSKGRETLERAINLVHNNEEWRARVVYGDTDSLFVLVPGRSRKDAFKIGAEIALAVTQDNPSPVKLKLEKVYQPCILQTKKRYVGFMYENPGQKQPTYEAKGIETVRRDGCPAVAKMLEKSLKILFETKDVSSVKKYACHQFSKILAGRANIQDLIFAREYRGKDNYRPGACVPALELAKRWLRLDRRAEPRIGERVPYVVVNGHPGSALIHLVRHPNELMSDSSLRYNAVYYISRVIIPPIARCFSLLGADVLSWYADLPRKSQFLLPVVTQAGFKKTISQYFITMECACCGTLTHGGVCSKCRANPQLLISSLMSKLHNLESTHSSITKICQSCLGRFGPLDCRSLDCPITYRRHQSSQKLEQAAFISQLLQECGFSPID